MFAYLQNRPGYFLAITIVLNILLHLPFINLPPCSIHVWRQCNTLAVARNFYEEDGNILKPRVDRRFDTDGVTGMQFPAYEWVLSRIYMITGEHYSIQRSYSLLITTLGLLAAAGFFSLLTGNAFFGALAAWILCWSPELFYQGINALPDIMAFSCGFGALYATYSWKKDKLNKQLIAAFLLITLAGLIKMQYGIFGIFMAVSIFSPADKSKSTPWKENKKWLIPGIISVMLICGWYVYANELIRVSGLNDYVLQLRPVSDGNQLLDTIRRNLISDLPELLLNYSNFIFFILGGIVLLRNNSVKRILVTPFFAAGMAFLCWYFLMMEQMRVHQYYMLPVLLITTFIILKGIRYCLERRFHLVAWILILCQPAIACIRILPARWMKDDLGIPAQFADSRQLKTLIEAVPSQVGVITGPDKSGCIWLYFLHKKGFSFEESKAFFEKQKTGKVPFEEVKKRGGRWMYIRKGEISNSILPIEGALKIKTIGEFEIYKVTSVTDSL